jgi:hypothetical protein
MNDWPMCQQEKQHVQDAQAVTLTAATYVYCAKASIPHVGCLPVCLGVRMKR